MAEKCSLSIKRLLQISLAIMLLFLLIISVLYYLFIYTFSQDQFESSFQTFSESIETQLDAQFHSVEQSAIQLSYFSNMQEILFSKDPLVYLSNISGCNQLVDYLKHTSPIITELLITSPYGHTFYSGSTGKYKYQQFAEATRDQSSPFLPSFMTIPPEEEGQQLPQLVYCFPVYNTLRPGYASSHYAFGMATIDINALANLSYSGEYQGEVKAFFYQDEVIHISPWATEEEVYALREIPLGKDLQYKRLRLGDIDYTYHTIFLEDLDMSIVDLVPTESLLQRSAVIRNIGTTVLLITCACLICSTWLLFRHLSIPVKQMVTDMQDIQAGTKKSLQLPKLEDLRYVAQSVNQTLEVLESANRRQQELSHTLYQTTLAQKQAQFNSYKNQISPHFLFNTLESMRSIAHHAKVPVLENMLTSLASLFRYSLRSSLVVPLRDELNHVQSYFNVMDIRTPQRYELRLRIDDNALNYPMLSMVLQPLVENSISHGFSQKRGFCILLIRAQVDGNGVLNLSVIDNGTGISPDKLRELDQRCRQERNPLQNSHIGLNNVLHRLHLFYGERFQFTLQSKEKHYTAVSLYIPKFPCDSPR